MAGKFIAYDVDDSDDRTPIAAESTREAAQRVGAYRCLTYNALAGGLSGALVIEQADELSEADWTQLRGVVDGFAAKHGAD